MTSIRYLTNTIKNLANIPSTWSLAGFKQEIRESLKVKHSITRKIITFSKSRQRVQYAQMIEPVLNPSVINKYIRIATKKCIESNFRLFKTI